MDLPDKMRDMLDEEGPVFQALFESTYKRIEQLGLKFHPQDSPNVIARHPNNGINCVTLWIKGNRGRRRIESEVRVDGFEIDFLSAGMRDEITIRKYDRGKKPLWWLLIISNSNDINRLCLIAKRIISVNPDWGIR